MSENTTPHTIGEEDITQQATAPTPQKKPATAKNPKRVAAGKLVAERTRRAREAQKKAAEEAAAITPTIGAVTAEEPSLPEKSAPEYSSLTTTQWLALGSSIVSLIGLYYKREDIKNALSKKPPPVQAPVPAPPNAKGGAAARGLRNMD